MPDDPTMFIAEIVARCKGRASHDLRQEFPHLRTRMPTRWSRSYFANTVGNVSATLVRRYIESQKGRR
jgi:putative transposase